MDSPADLAERLAAWRRKGAQRIDPLGFGILEALARRTAQQQGAARRLLDARLQALLADYPARFEQAQAAFRARRPLPPGSPLADLRQRLGGEASGLELKTVQQWRGTWTRLRTAQRLTQSMARAPEQAGPLNSHALVLRTLQQLQQLSPEYLDRFVAYAEALLAIDQAGLPPTPAPKERRRRPGAPGQA